MTAESESSYASDSVTVSVTPKDCFDFDVLIAPASESVCLGKSVGMTLSIENRGKSDTFRIIAPSWAKPQSDYVSIPENQKASVALNVGPEQPGQADLEVRVESGRDPLTAKTASATVDTRDCREVAVIISPSENIVCENAPVVYAVTVKNMGTVTDRYDISTTLGSLDSSEVVVDPGMTKSLKLSVNTAGLSGDRVIKVVARSDAASDETFANLGVKNCHSVSVDVEPGDISVCPCSKIDYTVKVRNTGERADNYTVTFGSQKETASLGPGKSADYRYTVTIPCDMRGSYTITAKAVSEKAESTGVSNLAVKDADQCWSADLLADGSAVLDVKESASVPVTVRNLGEQAATYRISVDGPDWVYVQPDEVVLNYGQEEDVFLYASPPLGTEKGTYTATVRAASKHDTREANVTLYVGTEPDAQKSDQQPQEIQPGITPGVGITGRFIGAVPAWKTMVVGFITLIIVMILVVRFAVLFKE